MRFIVFNLSSALTWSVWPEAHYSHSLGFHLPRVTFSSNILDPELHVYTQSKAAPGRQLSANTLFKPMEKVLCEFECQFSSVRMGCETTKQIYFLKDSTFRAKFSSCILFNKSIIHICIGVTVGQP